MYGFIRVACASPQVKLADCDKNAQEIIILIEKAHNKGASLIVFPELCITGYTCSDLFFQRTLQESALKALAKIAASTAEKAITAIVGLPFAFEDALYNVAAVCSNGSIVALVPKTHIPNYSEFYEKRHFAPAFKGIKTACVQDIFGKNIEVPLGVSQLFCSTTNKDLRFAIEICEDVWVPCPPSTMHAQNGATIIANLSASNEAVSKSDYRRLLVSSHSARLMCAYAYADAGRGESTTDLVFSAHNMIAENGSLLAESLPFSDDTFCVSDIDTERLLQERRKNTSFASCAISYKDTYLLHDVQLHELIQPLCRYVDPYPFIPNNKEVMAERCKEIIQMQTAGLIQRLSHIRSSSVVVGLSGGLDSTLALLIIIEAFKHLKLDLKGVIAITMPCFGTSDRTYNNALLLAKESGVTLKEIPIEKAVNIHFEDIGHDKNVHNATYENSQARERTQVLMDMANAVNGIVIGTGDLSELALGWATYNGDHMSMYGVNASVPKTLVRHLVTYYEKEAQTRGENKLAAVLHDIIETPVSPELIPPTDGKEIQATEEILGSYDLHDFFLYYFVRWGFTPEKIQYLAEHAFKCGTNAELFSKDEINKRLVLFIKRFFSQQFKRSCLPDGPKIGSISLSPRGDWRMPSDAHVAQWLSKLEG